MSRLLAGLAPTTLCLVDFSESMCIWLDNLDASIATALAGVREMNIVLKEHDDLTLIHIFDQPIESVNVTFDFRQIDWVLEAFESASTVGITCGRLVLQSTRSTLAEEAVIDKLLENILGFPPSRQLVLAWGDRIEDFLFLLWRLLHRLGLPVEDAATGRSCIIASVIADGRTAGLEIVSDLRYNVLYYSYVVPYEMNTPELDPNGAFWATIMSRINMHLYTYIHLNSWIVRMDGWLQTRLGEDSRALKYVTAAETATVCVFGVTRVLGGDLLWGGLVFYATLARPVYALLHFLHNFFAPDE